MNPDHDLARPLPPPAGSGSRNRFLAEEPFK